MVDLKSLQEKIYRNKIEKNFNVTDIYKEFCYLHIKIAEAIDAYFWMCNVYKIKNNQ